MFGALECNKVSREGKNVVEFAIDKYKLNNEQYLMALLCAKEMTEWQKAQAVQMAGDIDFQIFQQEVIEHRVWGLVMNNIRKLDLFPQECCAEISKKEKQQIFDSMKLTSELIKINRVFNKKSIRLLLMKGPMLGNRLYGDVTKRTSRDLDILVSLEDVDRAIDALNELGYQSRYSNKYTAKQMEYIYRQGHHFDFWNSEGIEIELHWRISETWDAAFEDLWGNRREINYIGEKITILGENEELMFLIHHGIGHGFHRMKWLIDIVELTKQGCVRWPQVIDYANRIKRLNELLAGIALCYAIEAFDMPDIFLEEIRFYQTKESIIINVCRESNENLLKAIQSAQRLINSMKTIVCYKNGSRNYTVDSKEYISYYHLYIREVDRFQDKKKIHRILERLQPGERDFNKVHLKDEFFALYYIIRIINWIHLLRKSKTNIDRRKDIRYNELN